MLQQSSIRGAQQTTAAAGGGQQRAQTVLRFMHIVTEDKQLECLYRSTAAVDKASESASFVPFSRDSSDGFRQPFAARVTMTGKQTPLLRQRTPLQRRREAMLLQGPCCSCEPPQEAARPKGLRGAGRGAPLPRYVQPASYQEQPSSGGGPAAPNTDCCWEGGGGGRCQSRALLYPLAGMIVERWWASAP